MDSLLTVLNVVWVGIVFVTMISILVAAHELGHYLFARMFGMGVEEFSIGMGGRRLVTWKQKFYTVPLAPGQDPMLPEADDAKFDATTGGLSSLEGRPDPSQVELVEEGGRRYLRERTDFTVRPLPIGGFVRIKGMLPEEDGSETRIPGGFYSKPPWQRLLVLFAGPLFSIVGGIAILIPLLMSSGKLEFRDRAVIGSIQKDKPGYNAGLREGDRIVRIDEKPVARFYDVLLAVRDSDGRELKFDVERGRKPLSFRVRGEKDQEPQPVLGADMEPTEERRIQSRLFMGPQTYKVPLGFVQASTEALRVPVKGFQGIVRMFTNPARLKENLHGPGTMVQATNDAVQIGVTSVLTLAALISISVGVLNLLPTPPLDGGQMAIALAEMLRGGRRLSLRVQIAAGTAGLVFVGLLMLTAVVFDVQRIFFSDKPSVSGTK